MIFIVLLLILLSLKFPWWKKNIAFHVPRFLMYHRVEPIAFSKEKWVVAPSQLEKHIQWLLKQGWSSFTVSELYDNKRPCAKAFALTFDDGFACFARHVLPLLQRYQVKATLFCLSDSTHNHWDQPRHPNRALLDHEALKQILESGFVELASHGCHHKNLTTLSDECLVNELQQSKIYFEERYVSEVRGFAYPFGQYNEKVKSFVKEAGYDYAMAVHNKVSSVSDWFEVSRITVDGRWWRQWDIYWQIKKGKRGL